MNRDDESLSPKPTAGRPKNPDIQRRIIQIAQLYFARCGFDNVTMDEIAQHSGTSKSTIYLFFASKEDLFKAALEELLNQLPPAADILPTRSESPISEQLLALAKRVNQLLSSTSFDLLRRTLASNISTPLRERIWQAAGLPYLDAIDRYLRAQSARGALYLGDSRSAASLFVALVAGGKALQSQLSGSSFGLIEEDHLRESVELFLRGYAALPAPVANL